MTEPYFLDIYSDDDPTQPPIQIFATPEQTDIINAAIRTKDNMLIEALAGSAKTTTLRFICKYHPVIPILSLAFNKRIAVTLGKVLPSHVAARTLNSVGHGTWQTAIGRKLTLDFKKSYNIVRTIIDHLDKRDRSAAFDSMGAILQAVTAAKRSGYVPEGKFTHAKPLKTKEEFYLSLEEEPTKFEASLIERALTNSITAAYAGTIDFDDQLYMPTLFGGAFPQFPLVLVDEAQDLSRVNHAMLQKLARTRVIAVGDPWQSIYGFRGAEQSGMDRIRETYSCVKFPLSVSFRCPEAIVRSAQFRVPHMKWSKPGGQVSALPSLAASDIPDGSAIICRNNAPLFHLALVLLSAGRGVHLVGTDLGPQLIKILSKLGPENLTQEETYAAIDDWHEERLPKARNKDTLADKVECLKVFAGFGSSLGDAIAYCEHLFSGQGPIQLLSGHKAKGLEWDVVFHLDPWRIPSKWAQSPEEQEQEKNLLYVITTRAREKLFTIDAANIEENESVNL